MEENMQSYWAPLVNSFLLILVSEIGDMTFCIAAILAMHQSRLAVYAGAMAANALMTALTVAMGFALPTFLSRKYTNHGAALLFAFYGYQLMQKGVRMREGPNDELEEAEAALKQKAKKPAEKSGRSSSRLLRTLLEAFSLTFLSEWGDRSQIATIAMATGEHPMGVVAGAIMGHGVCTALAVIGGRLLAEKVSEKKMTVAGGALFLLFAAHAELYPPQEPGT